MNLRMMDTNSRRLSMNKRTVKQLKGLPGIYSCLLSHEVTNTTYEMEWFGPKLNDIWPSVLAFFRWTNDTMNSESQVRLFVNTKLGRWAAWAFPQRARTGMSAKELKNKDDGYAEFPKQREQFSDADGWVYLGTAHHHCNMSAFQSGTDEANERNQDGLHITVGNMSQPKYDLHWRFYSGGVELSGVRLSDFWDCGDAINGLAEGVKKLLRSDALEVVALEQMSQPPPEGQEFPEQWRSNVVEVKVAPAPETGQFSHHTWTHGWSGPMCKIEGTNHPADKRGRFNNAWDIGRAADQVEIITSTGQEYELNDYLDVLENFSKIISNEEMEILEICFQHDVDPEAVACEIRQRLARAEKKNPELDDLGYDYR